VPQAPLWKERLLSFKGLIEGQEFRHGVGAVPASSIGAQFFCEMKVEQGFVHGEVETEEKTEGDALHEQLLPMEETSREKLFGDIEHGKLVVASFALAAQARDLVLVGVPDAVIFQRGRPTHVLELKTTQGDPLILFDGQRAQTLVYGLLLDQVGFDCGGLRLVVVKFRRQAPLSEDEKGAFLQKLTEVLISGVDTGSIATDSGGHIVAHSLAYSKDEALKVLSQTEGYWLGERAPIAATNPNKCRACEFKEVCPSSLAKA
jgi:hypothetical protein